MGGQRIRRSRSGIGIRIRGVQPRVTVYEVGPRDGLQNEAGSVPTDGKLALLRALADAGLSRIEATSFVSPRWIPQLADAAEVTARLPRAPGLSYVVLVPNAKGLARLLEVLDAAGEGRPPVEAAVFLSASETHNRKNVNKSVEETLRAFEEVIPPARARGMAVRGYVSTAWGCPYEGKVDPVRVAALVERLLALGCAQVSLGDTIGVGTPNETRRFFFWTNQLPISTRKRGASIWTCSPRSIIKARPSYSLHIAWKK